MNKWDKRFSDLADFVGEWSSCYQDNRHVGAVIVKDKRIQATGYNGAPSGVQSCKDKGECLRKKLNIASGTRHEVCYAVHAEQNAIAQAAKLGVSVEGSTIYVTHQPCTICTKMIINSGIKKVIYKHGYPDDFSKTLLSEAGVELIKVDDLDK
ncbi:MAG: dCMP deaminase family protein [Clostridia bacterium]|nr:dCMP deaminase family protein [Clostridia bacterium]